MRHAVMIHNHIFKNAGTSLDAALSASFGDAFVELMATSATGRIKGSDLLDFLLRNPEIRCVSSHVFHASILDEDIDGIFFESRPLSQGTLIRHPFSRLRSMYRFLRGGAESGALPDHARNGTLRDFIGVLLDRFPHQCNNSQVLTLGIGGIFRPPARFDLDRATSRLHRMAFVGVVERFDESMVATEYSRVASFPNLDLATLRMNATTALAESDGAAGVVEEITAEIGSDMASHLLAVNELDIELWEAASDELSRRIRLIPDWQRRLSEYRTRCSAIDLARSVKLGWRKVSIP